MAASALALALTASPASAGTNPNTSYEVDCTSGLLAGQSAVPFVVTANLNGIADPSFPTGASFKAAGALSFSITGGTIGGFAQNNVLGSGNTTVGLTIGGMTFASADGTASGSYNYSHVFSPVVAPTGTVSASWTSGSNTVTGNFTNADLGSGVRDAAVPANQFPVGATIVAVNPGVSATVFPAPTASGSGTLTLYRPMTFTDASVDTGNVFTTSGTDGGASSIALTSVPGAITLNVALNAPFGGQAGVGDAPNSACLVTGYDAANNPGPGQIGSSGGPVFPAGTIPTALLAASGGTISQPGTSQQITPAPAAFVSLDDPPPTASNASVNLAVGGSKTITLPTSDPDATPTTGCAAVGVPSDPRIAVTFSNSPTVCQAQIVDSGSGPDTVTFQFNATDGVSSGNTATISVNIGTAPVDEPLVQDVNAGQLVLSCSNPDTNGGTPLLECPDFNFAPITLNGLEQTTTGAGSTLYVSDNRGDPSAGWSLSAFMVATPIGVGSNPNASCAAIVAFCNADVGSNAIHPSGNGQIAKSNLSIGSIGCAPHAGNLNVAATAGSGGSFSSTQTICTATAAQSGGTFDVTKTYTLDIPSSVYAGTYWGTVQDLVQ
jgi:hypothetical protein